ncbi:MAG: ABC transporter substrate-binding protein [Clostridia bacterium]|nr:ABC transporter substrate-binding protein [Clostridia bacterium]
MKHIKHLKTLLVVLSAALCLAQFVSCGAQGSSGSNDADNGPENAADWTAVTVKDDLGREVTITREPKKVAALMGSFAEVWMLAGGKVAATVKDAWEDFGLDLGDDVKNLGTYMSVSLEALFDCEADLVIASSKTKNHIALKDQLERAGVNVLYFDGSSFESYLSMLKRCTRITGRADLYEQNGVKVAEQVGAVKQAAEKAAKEQGAPRVLLLRIAASNVRAKGSSDTVLGLMLADLGCENIADGSDLLEDLSLEKIIIEDPDRILIVQQGSDSEGAEKLLKETLTGNPAWAGLTAVKEGRVHRMERSLYHFKPNVRWGTAYEKLEKILY